MEIHRMRLRLKEQTHSTAFFCVRRVRQKSGTGKQGDQIGRIVRLFTFGQFFKLQIFGPLFSTVNKCARRVRQKWNWVAG
jgi:hypothetical protein